MKKALLISTLAALSASAAHAVTLGNLLAYYDFDGQTDDQSANGAPSATLNAGAALTAPGTGYDGTGQAMTTAGTGYGFVGAGTHLDSAATANSMAVSFWQLNAGIRSSSSFWVTSPTAANNQRGMQAHAAWGNGSIFFDSSGCCGSPQTRLTDNPVAGGAAGSAIDVGNWQHLVFQIDSDGSKEVWLNGSLYLSQASGANALQAFNGEIVLGAERDPFLNVLDGNIDDFAVWNSNLTPAEIGLLAGGTSVASLVGIPEPSAGLLGLLAGALLLVRRRR